MRKFTLYIILAFVFVLSGNIFSQNNSQKNIAYLNKLRQIAMFKENPDWIIIKPEKNINAKRIFEFYKEAFGFGKFDKMELTQSKKDKLGITNYKFQQLYKGIPVEGALYIVHEKNGRALKANGRPVRNLDLSDTPSISSQEAVTKAISFVPATKYIWEGNDSEYNYPEAKLVFMNTKFSQDPASYKLVYKIEVYAEIPHKRVFVYVDAKTGIVIHSINMIQTTDKNVIVPTKYNSNRLIVLDSVNANLYRLRETGRGNGVQTFDMHNSTIYGVATDVTDTDTIFSNDDVANNAHWAAEMTYDYYMQKHARNSFDDNGGILKSYVHYDADLANAMWDGSRMSYGDGNGTSMTAFTTIDICGHEITHGVTQYAANLIYQDEPGALNEAFSDIFGTCIEFYADSIPNWLMGEDIGSPIRSMSNPKLYQQPNTYHGQYWEANPANDNGGVHTNSGVLNYWFYLLCAGGTGTNDLGNTYQISALGMDTTAAIAYRMLTAYLIESSQYMDAYHAGINAATDLYGACSDVVKEVAAAFAAVGVGYPISNDKVYLTDVFSPVTKCGLSNEQLKIKLFYNGCGTSLSAGDSVLIAYSLDNGPISYDTMIIANLWSGGDTINYTVPQTLTITTVGQHKVDVWVKYITDSATTYNDSIKNYYFQNLLQQNIDFGITKITSPLSGCGLSASEIVQAKFMFFGCDSFPAGDTITLAYSVNDGDSVYEDYIIPVTIFPGDTLTYTFTTLADISALHGMVHLDAWTAYNEDFLTTNDAITYTFANPISLRDDTVTFDLLAASNYYYVETTPYSRAWATVAAHHTGPKGLQMTGGNPMVYYTELEIPDGQNTWTVNAFLSAKANFCVDATGWTNAILKFDLKQTHGGVLYNQYLGDPIDYYKIFSNLRILVNDQQIGNTYNPTTPGSDPWVTYTINLNQYAGTEFVSTFETRNIGKDTLGMKMDNAYIDNVVFYHCIEPDALFTYTATNLTVDFTNQSQHATSYLWLFDDSTTSTLQNPQHIFASPGNYLVKLYATGECGTDSSIINIQVTCNVPDASFIWAATNLTVNFTNQTSNANSYLWNFGDGDTSSQQTPVHSYATAGNYVVTLFTYNSCGIDTFITSVLVASGISENNIYDVQVYPNPVKNKLYINFNGTSTIESVHIRMLDITGRLIFDKPTDTHGVFDVPVVTISSGMYILEIAGDNAVQRIRIEVEK